MGEKKFCFFSVIYFTFLRNMDSKSSWFMLPRDDGTITCYGAAILLCRKSMMLLRWCATFSWNISPPRLLNINKSKENYLPACNETIQEFTFILTDWWMAPNTFLSINLSLLCVNNYFLKSMLRRTIYERSRNIIKPLGDISLL